jgi:hypothetical protein
MMEGNGSHESTNHVGGQYPIGEIADAVGAGVTAANAEITAPLVPAEGDDTAVETPRAERPLTPLATMTDFVLQRVDTAEKLHERSNEAAAALRERIDQLEDQYNAATNVAAFAASDRDSMLSAGRMRAWAVMPKNEQGTFASGPESVSVAVALTPHTNRESPEVRNARVQAVEQAGQRIQEGVPILINYAVDGDDLKLRGVVPEHSGFSVVMDERRESPTFLIGINGEGEPINTAVGVEITERADGSGDDVQVGVKYGLYQGEDARQVINATCNVALLTVDTLDSDFKNRTAGHDEEYKEHYAAVSSAKAKQMNFVVDAVHAAQVLGEPVVLDDPTLALGLLYEHVYDSYAGGGAHGRTRIEAAKYTGEAIRALLPAGRGNEAMAKGMIDTASKRDVEGRNTLHRRTILRLVAEVCNIAEGDMTLGDDFWAAVAKLPEQQ